MGVIKGEGHQAKLPSSLYWATETSVAGSVFFGTFRRWDQLYRHELHPQALTTVATMTALGAHAGYEAIKADDRTPEESLSALRRGVRWAEATTAGTFALSGPWDGKNVLARSIFTAVVMGVNAAPAFVHQWRANRLANDMGVRAPKTLIGHIVKENAPSNSAPGVGL